MWITRHYTQQASIGKLCLQALTRILSRLHHTSTHHCSQRNRALCQSSRSHCPNNPWLMLAFTISSQEMPAGFQLVLLFFPPGALRYFTAPPASNLFTWWKVTAAWGEMQAVEFGAGTVGYQSPRCFNCHMLTPWENQGNGAPLATQHVSWLFAVALSSYITIWYLHSRRSLAFSLQPYEIVTVHYLAENIHKYFLVTICCCKDLRKFQPFSPW